MLKRCFYIGVAVAVAVGPGGLLVGAVGGAALLASTFTESSAPSLREVTHQGSLREAYVRNRAHLKPSLKTIYGGR